MRHINQLIILLSLLVSSDLYAGYDIWADPLYWQATETLDWVHTNNLNPPNLVIGYRGISFHHDPGIRLGFGYRGSWDTNLYLTLFDTRGTDSVSGNLTSGFIGGRLSQTIPATLFFQTGQADFHISYHTFDWDVGKHFDVTNKLMLRPMMGLKAGIIDQTYKTSFQGEALSISETVKNNFKGVGPKARIETNIVFWQDNNTEYSLIADFETAYMWGHWHVTDREQTSRGGSVHVYVSPRNFGAIQLQGMLGANVSYKNISANLRYEISDWFNQCQILDDETGTQNNDLVLQGLTLGLVYRFA